VPAKSDKQFKRAVELQARYTFRLERNPEGELVVKLKNLATREEKTIPVGSVADALR
jgi:histidyl-tRNA synthetase